MNLVRDGIAVDHPPVRPPRSSRRLWVSAAVAAGTVALVTGALVATPGGERASTVVERDGRPTASPSSLPPDTAADVVPEPAPPAPPERLSESSRVRLDGVGPVVVGMTLDEASAAAGMPIRMIPNSDAPGTGTCAYARPEGGPEGLHFMLVNGKIVRVEVGRSPMQTLSGVGTGSTEAEVLAAYPDRISVQLNPYSGHRGGRDLLYLPDQGSRHLGLLFQADGGRVTSFRSGLLEAVMAPEGCA